MESRAPPGLSSPVTHQGRKRVIIMAPVASAATPALRAMSSGFGASFSMAITAATRIIIDQRRSVLRVPNQALRYVPTGTDVGDAKQPRIWVLRNDAPAPVQVTIGLDDDEFTEIVQGELKPDDRVIVGEQNNSAKARSSVPAPRL